MLAALRGGECLCFARRLRVPADTNKRSSACPGLLLWADSADVRLAGRCGLRPMRANTAAPSPSMSTPLATALSLTCRCRRCWPTGPPLPAFSALLAARPAQRFCAGTRGTPAAALRRARRNGSDAARREGSLPSRCSRRCCSCARASATGRVHAPCTTPAAPAPECARSKSSTATWRLRRRPAASLRRRCASGPVHLLVCRRAVEQ